MTFLAAFAGAWFSPPSSSIVGLPAVPIFKALFSKSEVTMRKIPILLFLLLAVAGGAFAQPVATGAVNAASYARAGLPNGGLVQGGMLVVFGTGMGGTVPQQLSFPLTTELDGVSIEVTVGTSVDCIMIYALSTQSACILPSNTPLGAGTLTVTANGQTSAPLPIEVVAHSFGIFSINNAGSGPGVLTDPNFVVNTLVQAAHPGEAWTIWGTGLSAVAGDEASGALPGDLPNLDVTVLVGGIEAEVLYRGRSGCCAGIDQIAFFVPEGVSGCYVPVAVLVEGVTSNFASMSIAESGNVCSESSGLLTSGNLQNALEGGSMRFGSVGLSRSSSSFAFPGVGQTIESYTESAYGSFSEFNLDQLLRTQSLFSISTIGACNVVQITGSDAEFEDPILPTELDAGPALTITGPNGTETMPREEFGYSALFSTPGFPGLPLRKATGRVGQTTGPTYLIEGDYTITGPGGADVGPFTANITIPSRLIWTNRDSIPTVIRAQGQPITWTGGDTSGYVQITGSSITVDEETENFLGGFFFCRAAASAGSFNIPAAVLLALPVSTSIEGFSLGTLAVGNTTDGNTFDANGLDLGVVAYSDDISKSVDYQ